MECGGSPPLFAVRACPDLPHERAITAIVRRKDHWWRGFWPRLNATVSSDAA